MESMSPQQTKRAARAGWSSGEDALLFERAAAAQAAGRPLKAVFDDVARQTGRRPNSVRNYYYARVKQGGGCRHAPAFVPFTEPETRALLEAVLAAQAAGESVRACTLRLGGGDQSAMLRYQNKYRSTIRTRPELVRRVMQRLSEEGVAYVSPYAAQEEAAPCAAPSLAQLKKRARDAGDAQLEQLFVSLDHLMDLALSPRAQSGGESSPAMPGAPDSEALRRADRLSARCDMLRIALCDEQMRRSRLQSEAEGMVTLIKEYIALPEPDRASHCAAFCQQAAARLSAVECALMPEET